MRIRCTLAMLALLLGLAPQRASAACGDGVRDGSEECDGADLGGQTCASVTAGFVQGGTLSCNPDCTFNEDDCRRFFLASLIPGRGSPKNRCQLEWTVAGTTPKSNQSTRRDCSDGEAGCDQDKSFNGVCTMVLQLCLNVPDPKVSGCTSGQPGMGKVFRLDVLQPAGDQQVVTAVLSAAARLATAVGSTASLGGSSASFNPPITSPFACGQGTIQVPLRGSTGRARPGKLRLRVRSSDNSGRIRSTGNLTVVCNP